MLGAFWAFASQENNIATWQDITVQFTFPKFQHQMLTCNNST